MDARFLAFSVFSTIAVFGSLMVVLKKNPVASAFALVTVFFSFAGLYAVMAAHLVAALQILVYTGAIMVLFVFVIMLLNQDSPIEDLKASSGAFKAIAALAVGVLVYLLIRVALLARGLKPAGTLTDEAVVGMGGNVQVISESLFSDHLFHFELTSFLLLGAIVGTIALAKRSTAKGGAAS
ncbi:MAG: NADH-quinone oxidoreductase subunit J [Proteobacteria bacterium]|nr:NADH-quinone oxidoreductase subunit J [Pseudomonadota bacterium]